MAKTNPRLDVTALAQVRARTLVLSGDDDVVTVEHTLALDRDIPDTELAVVPGTSHLVFEGSSIGWCSTSRPPSR